MAGIPPEMRHMMRLARSTPETEQARRVLAWLDARLPQWLAALGHREALGRYRKARQVQGTPARGDAEIRGGPRIHGVKADVVGTPDEMYGHHRLRAIVTEVMVPLVEAGQLDRGLAGELQEQLRGAFAMAYRQLERALARARRDAGESEKGDAGNSAGR